MYAILIELNGTRKNADELVNGFMVDNGFTQKQGGLYFGNDTINAVTCVLIIQKLAKKYDWFVNCVKDVRMLRIEENGDLIPAVI